MALNGSTWLQMVSNGFRRLQMAPGGSTCKQMGSRRPDRYRICDLQSPFRHTLSNQPNTIATHIERLSMLGSLFLNFESRFPSNCAIIPSKPQTIIESALLHFHPACITQPRDPFPTHWAPKSTPCHPFGKTKSDLHLQSFPTRQTR